MDFRVSLGVGGVPNSEVGLRSEVGEVGEAGMGVS